MLDFSCALYLGMRHPTYFLKPWDKFSDGKPAALEEPKESRNLADQIAELQGCEAATLAPSTLHLFWDLFGLLGGKVIIYADKGLYPIGRWGGERAVFNGAVVREFAHYNADMLRQVMEKDSLSGRTPLIVTDGFCPSCGKAAPVSQYLKHIESSRGYLVIDDTQSLGILGYCPSMDNPYGKGGGGILRWSNNVKNPHILVIGSMAKAFGVPLAILCASREIISRFKELSKVRVHCSPPSYASIYAAQHALALNRKYGEKLRLHLLQLIRYFRRFSAQAGFIFQGGLFPVQTLVDLKSHQAAWLHENLLQNGIKSVLHKAKFSEDPFISFIINALHSFTDIDYLINVLVKLTSSKSEACYEIRSRLGTRPGFGMAGYGRYL